jgi:hypothetical protein
MGAFVWKGNQLPADQQPAAAARIENVTHSSLSTPIRLTATLLWLATALAVAAAHYGNDIAHKPGAQVTVKVTVKGQRAVFPRQSVPKA